MFIVTQARLIVWVRVFLSSNVSIPFTPHPPPPLRLPRAAPDASQYCSCSPLDSKQWGMRARKQISSSVFWPPSGKQERRRHVRNSELNSDLNLENKGRALWGRTMKLWIHNFKSPCWRQAVWTRFNISNAHQLPFRKAIFVVVFAPPPQVDSGLSDSTRLLGRLIFFFFSRKMIRIVTLQAGAQCYLPILNSPFRTQLSADSALHGKDAPELKREVKAVMKRGEQEERAMHMSHHLHPARLSTVSIPRVSGPLLNSALAVLQVTAAGLLSPEMPIKTAHSATTIPPNL